MLKKHNDRTLSIKQNLKGGIGAIEIKHYFEKNEFVSGIRHCSETIIPLGASIGMHRHENEEEIYIITGGKGIVKNEDCEYYVEEGDSILTKHGESHSITNIGNKELKVIAIIITY